MQGRSRASAIAVHAQVEAGPFGNGTKRESIATHNRWPPTCLQQLVAACRPGSSWIEGGIYTLKRAASLAELPIRNKRGQSSDKCRASTGQGCPRIDSRSTWVYTQASGVNTCTECSCSETELGTFGSSGGSKDCLTPSTRTALIEGQIIRLCRRSPRRLNCNRTRVARTTTTAMMLGVMFILLGGFSSVGPPVVHSLTINPSWEWLGQRLFECDIAKENLATKCQCYVYDTNAVVKCQENEPAEPEAETKPGRWKSCTHDPKVQYRCTDPMNPVSPLFRPLSVLLVT